jgi:low affinity Fe/Cu permease
MFNFFWAQNIICSALFLGVAIAAVVQLAMLDERRRKLKKNNYATWTLYSVIAFIGFERILYLLLDPYRYRGIIGAIAESILFGLATWGLVCVYLMILIMWIKMYRATRNSESLVSKFVKYIWALMGLVFVVQVIYDVIRAIFAAGQGRTVALIVYFAIAIICSLFVSIVFLVYGRLLYRRLIKFKDQDPSRQKKINKVTRFTTTASIIVISYSLALLTLIVVTLVYGEDVLVFLISHFLQRLIEVGACTAILITHHVNIRQHKIQISTTGGSTNNSSVRSRSMSAFRTSSTPVIDQPVEKDEEASAGENSVV